VAAEPAAPSGPPTFLFAAQQDGKESKLYLDLLTGEPSPVLRPELAPPPEGCRVEFVNAETPDRLRICLTVPPAPPGADDDELTFQLRVQAAPACHVVLRRTTCKLTTPLIERHGEISPRWPQTRAALLWYGWKRYREIVGLKRFSTGRGGSDVLVFQPGLREPPLDQPVTPAGVLGQAWGSCFLVKTGAFPKVFAEWECFHTFLADRLHPFMTRSEAFLAVQAANVPPPEPSEPLQATLIGSFLGGNVLQVEPFEMLVRGSASTARCLEALEKLFALSATWYAGATTAPLAQWGKVFRRQETADGPTWKLFGKYDLSRDVDRLAYALPLSWDQAFTSSDHLHRHLLGKGTSTGQGLLHRLMQIEARYSLVHGDLHARNVLVDRDNVWLLDFGETGVGPTLADFAKLEVFLRLWCLELSPEAKATDEGAAEFERRLLDHLTGSEGSLEPLREVAAELGAQPENLVKVAACISWLRRRAASYSQGSPDRRDYLAVLFLTVLQTLRYAGRQPEYSGNYRLLLALYWQLEEVLSRLVGLAPFPRGRLPLAHQHLVTRQWLAAPRAPARVAYFLDRPDGQKALWPLLAARGVLQNPNHHLDVLDHTLLVLANLEELLEDPLGALLDPAAFEARVERSLQEQGLRLGVLRMTPRETGRPNLEAVQPYLEEIRACLKGLLDEPTRLLLKWVALLHDAGKPATRALNQASPEAPLKVQFLRHEIYGLQLLEDYLEHLYPRGEMPDAQARMRSLIHRHHCHHNLLDWYLEGGRLAGLLQALAAHDPRHPEVRHLWDQLGPKPPAQDKGDFPLLLLHGLADVAACRGPLSTTPLRTVAEIDLVLLSVYVRRPRFQHRQQMEALAQAKVKAATAGLGLREQALGQVRKRLQIWFLERTCGGTPEEGYRCIPADGELRAKAAEIMKELSERAG
jgi:hypothetical protein